MHQSENRIDLLRSVAREADGAPARATLATAAGQESALARSLALLAPSSLDAAQATGSPSVIEIAEHVEALAAWSPYVLARVASGWPAPAERLHNGAWIAAWRTAARHLAPRGRIRRRDLEHEPFAEELAVLWPAPDKEPCSFASLAEFGRALTAAEARRLAASGLRDDVIQAASVARAEPSLLRLLRGAEDRMTEEAFQVVLARLLRWRRIEPSAAAMLAELVRGFAPDALEELRVEVAFALQANALPAPLVLALMTDWRIP
jgi:hypothetical protein